MKLSSDRFNKENLYIIHAAWNICIAIECIYNSLEHIKMLETWRAIKKEEAKPVEIEKLPSKYSSAWDCFILRSGDIDIGSKS